MGYVNKGSVVSLYSGVVCGVAAVIGSRMSGSVRFQKAGLIVLAITGGVLAAIFSRRILATGEFMPGGFLFLNSGGMLLAAVRALKEVADEGKQATTGEESPKTESGRKSATGKKHN